MLLTKSTLLMLYYQVCTRCCRHVCDEFLLRGQILMAIGVRVWIWRSVRLVGEQVAFVIVWAEAAFLLLETVNLQGKQRNTV